MFFLMFCEISLQKNSVHVHQMFTKCFMIKHQDLRAVGLICPLSSPLRNLHLMEKLVSLQLHRQLMLSGSPQILLHSKIALQARSCPIFGFTGRAKLHVSLFHFFPRAFSDLPTGQYSASIRACKAVSFRGYRFHSPEPR